MMKKNQCHLSKREFFCFAYSQRFETCKYFQHDLNDERCIYQKYGKCTSNHANIESLQEETKWCNEQIDKLS